MESMPDLSCVSLYLSLLIVVQSCVRPCPSIWRQQPLETEPWSVDRRVTGPHEGVVEECSRSAAEERSDHRDPVG